MSTKVLTLGGKLIAILLFSIIIGHYFPPAGILSIPIVISIGSALIVFTDNDLSVFTQILFAYAFIALNDIGIKLFSGGIHDMEGMGWIHLLFFTGLVPCFIILTISVFRNKAASGVSKISSISLFVLLVCLHLMLFDQIGLDR